MKFASNNPTVYRLKLLLVFFLIFFSVRLFAQEEVKKGYSLGVLPTISFDSDFGLMYGVMGRVFYYGDGSVYPDYLDYYNVLISRYSSGCGRYEIGLETDRLIRNMRTNIKAGYKDKQLSQFYGFNGYESEYNSGYTDVNSSNYISRMFYNTQEDIFNVSFNVERNRIGQYLRWGAGLNLYYYNIYSVDIAAINKRKKNPADYMPLQSEMPYLFELYRDSLNIIDSDETKGWNNSVSVQIIYDKRDLRINTMKGLYFVSNLSLYPKFAGNGSNYAYLNLDFRQYINFIPERLSLAYRVNYKQTIGNAPFRHYFNNAAGGMYSIRGVSYNRVMGKGVAYTNVELRTRPFYFNMFKERRFVGINLFYDAGVVVDKLYIPESVVKDKDSIHSGVGGSLLIGLSPNFGVNIMIAKALDPRDGSLGFGFDMALTF